jgi:chromatin remodeling complex protein RSC6
MPKGKKNAKSNSAKTSTKAVKSKKVAKKTTKSKEQATKVVESATAPPAPAKVAAEVAVPSLADAFGELLGQLTALRSQLTSVTGQVRALQKRADRELKNAHKASKKRARRTGNRAPSGFVKPTKISSELAAFLGKPKGTEMARTEVTREINGYIRQHDLQDPKNGRRILADAKLRKLLKLKSSDELTYFNLQRYMSPHFAKKAKATAVSV